MQVMNRPRMDMQVYMLLQVLATDGALAGLECEIMAMSARRAIEAIVCYPFNQQEEEHGAIRNLPGIAVRLTCMKSRPVKLIAHPLHDSHCSLIQYLICPSCSKQQPQDEVCMSRILTINAPRR